MIKKHGYIANVKGRGREARELKREPEKKTSRWVVEVAHSWFNRFRKLLVRYEKLDRSFLAFSVPPSGCEKSDMGVIARCPVMHLAQMRVKRSCAGIKVSFRMGPVRCCCVCLRVGGCGQVYGCQQRHAAWQSHLHSVQSLLYGTHYPGVVIHARSERGTLVHCHATRIGHMANRIVQR